MSNGYRRGCGPQARGFYDPYSKNIQWGQGISQLLRNLQMMKQFRQDQEQQRWQRNITEQELELRRRRLEQPKEKSIAEQRWDMADEQVNK